MTYSRSSGISRVRGLASKLQVESPDGMAEYRLRLGNEQRLLNDMIGQSLSLRFHGEIRCGHCAKVTKKSYSQGYCFQCMQTLPQCDSCIMSPEKCHLHLGSCRDAEWGKANCEIDHIVYLANSSGLKIGITRHSQVPTRWLDQGAVAAVPLYRVATRRLSGLIEAHAKGSVADKTNWRAMLKNEVPEIDLSQAATKMQQQLSEYVEDLQFAFGANAIMPLVPSVWTTDYPVSEYPTKVVSLNLEKLGEVAGKLMGIKGQYLIFDTGVINLRKYTGYDIECKVS